MEDITAIAPLKHELTDVECLIVFEYFSRRLVDHRNLAVAYADAEQSCSKNEQLRIEYVQEVDRWANEMLRQAWAACDEPGSQCPRLEVLTETSISDLPRLPSVHLTAKILNTIIFLHLTTTRTYSSQTRAFLLRTFGTFDECAVARILKNPEQATQAAQAKNDHADGSDIWRRIGIGAGAVAGGILVGMTGGSAAPLVGAGLGKVLAILGIGGPIGLIATGLASSGAVCGALFGAIGAKETAKMVARHTREIRDFAFLPVHEPKDSLAVRLCVSGWLTSEQDVTVPWKVFDLTQDTFALQWEVEALKELSSALYDLLRLHAVGYITWQFFSYTALSTLMDGLSPLFLLQIGQIIDNPWSNAKALSIKAGKVLGTLLANRTFGNRPVVLTGYSLGSLVLVEALKHLATLPVAQTAHVVQDVFLFGTPVPTNASLWTAMRRVVAGRLVNGYAETDYVLAILSRTSDGSWNVAGLHPVEVQGVENVRCDEVGGHLQWRGMVGRCLQICGLEGLVVEEVEMRVREASETAAKEGEVEEPIKEEAFIG
ncbi:DUF726-domain-containing protein [Hysterangium stoloniferum]|nr:DUF726-domain-containing protein [Hysterangium stoloniferum]